MTVLLYAITGSEQSALDAGPGISGQPLRHIGVEGLRAVVSDHDQPPGDDINTLLAYEAVMERLLEQTRALLPARFGTTAASDEMIASTLAARRAELSGRLADVAGAVEIAVHPDREEAEAARPGSGKDYMLARLNARKRIEQVDQAAAGLFRARVQRGANSTAYLVDVGDIHAFVERTATVGATVTGPWPPYSFVGGGEA